MKNILQVIAIASMFAATTTQAQVEEKLTFGNTEVAVRTETGYINFFANNFQGSLSYPGTSFFSLRIGSEVYTNNGEQRPGMQPLGDADVVKANNKIVAKWTISNVLVEQVVESRQNTASNTVAAVRYYVTNQGSVDIEVEPQYLLDVRIGKADGREYKLQGGSGSSLSKEWAVHTTIPDYVTFYEDEWEPPRYDQGESSDLSFDDAMFARPSLLMFGDWKHMEDQPFLNSDVPFPTSFILDLAVGMQWKSQVITPGARKEIAIFSYGPSIHLPMDVDPTRDAQLSLWPNPVSSQLHVRSSDEAPGVARIQNALGQTVWSGVVAGDTSIDVSRLAAGTYFFVRGDGGGVPFVVSR